MIIPLYTREWSRGINDNSRFPTRDFYSEELRADLPLGKVRGLDRYRQPEADSDKVLIDMMRPTLLVSRLDFSDRRVFLDTSVFTLYKEMFPEVERDPPEDIVDWVLHRDVGELRRVPLSDGTEVVYRLDSRFFILVLARRAIGFAFFTYDFTHKIVYGNYMAVHKCWRSGGIALEFGRRIEEVLKGLFPDYLGTVFEVEVLDENNLERIISGLEARGDKKFESEEDFNQIRRFLRISVWQAEPLNCKCFWRKDNKKPLVCRSPCLDIAVPIEDWEDKEEDYWLMWYDRRDSPLSQDGAGDVWNKVVKSIRIEILAKSVIDAFPDLAEQYWRHANAVVTRNLRDTEARGVCLGKFLHRRGWDLPERWYRLGIPISI